jgi:hypothetical protein
MTFLLNVVVSNDWFVGPEMPELFISYANEYYIVEVCEAMLGLYRIVLGVIRYGKAASDDTAFGAEDRADARIVVISGLVLLSCAAVLYIAVDHVAPLIWRLK